MRFNCGLTWEKHRQLRWEKYITKREQWRTKFAWWPKRFDNTCVWLEWYWLREELVYNEFDGYAWVRLESLV